MCAFLYPDEYLDSTYSIDFDQLYKQGYRGVIFDIDNTLVPHGAPADERAISLFTHLKELGFQCMLLSNNKEPRVKMFNDAVHVNYIYKAGKPKPSGYRKAMEKLGTDTGNICWRSDFYGCVWCKSGGDPHDTCQADSSEGRNSDRVEAPSGSDCASVLPAAPETGETEVSVSKKKEYQIKRADVIRCKTNCICFLIGFIVFYAFSDGPHKDTRRRSLQRKASVFQCTSSNPVICTCHPNRKRTYL